MQEEISSRAKAINGRQIRMSKTYTNQKFNEHTVLTDDVFAYVKFYYAQNEKKMIYKDSSKEIKYGDAEKYNYKFYWEQAEVFYHASKSLPVESAPLAAYYCMLNAVKSYLAFSSDSVDEFVEDFLKHGLCESKKMTGETLDSIGVYRINSGVFTKFAKKIDKDFEKKWPNGSENGISLKALMYNLVFIHRAYVMTYSTREKEVEELFLPLKRKDMPRYYEGLTGNVHVGFYVDTSRLGHPNANGSFEDEFLDFKWSQGDLYYSKESVATDDLTSKKFMEFNNKMRSKFSYIRGGQRLWYVKKQTIQDENVINLCSMTLTFAVMHRISEIVRYKPEQLNRLMASNENWLLHEFINLALDQFMDEIATEITKKDIMPTGIK